MSLCAATPVMVALQVVAPKRAALAEANKKLGDASKKLSTIRAKVQELRERVESLEGSLMKVSNYTITSSRPWACTERSL